MPEGRGEMALLLTQLPGLKVGLSPACVPRIPKESAWDHPHSSREAGIELARGGCKQLPFKKLNILPGGKGQGTLTELVL